ncbi:MAG TPA: hypothetical protein VGI19_04375 [Candidatus Cybelea sp.]
MYDAIPRKDVCTGKLLFVWGVYGCAMASLAQFVRAQGWSDLTSWSLALLAGVCLAVALREL